MLNFKSILLFASLIGFASCKKEPANTKQRQAISAGLHTSIPVPKTHFDKNAQFTRVVEKGRFTEEERNGRFETLARGEVIFHDIGLDFYRVQKGDTISGIRQRLARYPKYAYVASQNGKMNSFNIPQRRLQLGLLIPIPMEDQYRHMTDEQFAGYCSAALAEMRVHTHYGPLLAPILKKVSETEVIAAMVAVAKQESGGRPLGQFEWHRWEPHHRRFSFSIFHILMEGPGLQARRTLDFTEGQVYHPKNAGKLFLAFLVEKEKAVRRLNPNAVRLEHYFPLNVNAPDFAVFYNGQGWSKWNPGYVTQIRGYYEQAVAMMLDLATPREEAVEMLEVKVAKKGTATPVNPNGKARVASPKQVAESKVEFAVVRKNAPLYRAVEDANFMYARRFHESGVLRTSTDVHRATRQVMKYLRASYGDDTYFTTDKVGVDRDKRGAIIVFRRGKTDAVIRLK